MADREHEAANALPPGGPAICRDRGVGCLHHLSSSTRARRSPQAQATDHDNPGYDALKDFAPVAQLATFDLGIAVGPAVPAPSLRELAAWLKAHPAQASYGIPAAGSLPQFFALMFAQAAQVDMRSVPYKGNPPALADLMGGHLPVYFTSTQDLVEGHKS